MRNRKFRMETSVLYTLLLFCSTTAIAEEFVPERSAAVIAPYLLQEHNIIARIDVREIHALASERILKQLSISRRSNRFEQISTAKIMDFRHRLLAAGVDEIFCISSVERLPRFDYEIIAPIGPNSDARKAASLLFSGKPDGASERRGESAQTTPFELAEKVGDAVYCGSHAGFQRLKRHLSRGNTTPFARSLAEAFKAAGPGIVQLVVDPSDMMRVMRELNPQFPIGIQLTGAQLADGVQSIVGSIQKGDDVHVAATDERYFLLPTKLSIQSKDVESAEQIDGAVLPLLEMFGKGDLDPRVLRLAKRFARKDDRFIAQFEQLIELIVDEAESGISSTASRDLDRRHAMNKLRQIALAHINFESAYGGFAPHASFDSQGKPLLSWRVFVLPFMDEQELFKQFRLNEPWDSPHNLKLVGKMPSLYQSSGAEPGKTRFMVPVGPTSMFRGQIGIQVRDVKDGISRTVMVIQAPKDRAVVWTKPADWEFDLANPKVGFFADGEDAVCALGDSATVTLSPDLDDESMRRYLEIADGKIDK